MMAFLNDIENAFEILNTWLVMSRKWDYCILTSKSFTWAWTCVLNSSWETPCLRQNYYKKLANQ